MRYREIIAALLLALPFAAHAEVKINPPPKEQCDLLIKSLKDELDHGNYCRDDSECVIVPLGCPLPCNGLMNINEPVARIAALKDGYDKLCGSCEKECAEPKAEPVCVNHKCVYAK